MRTIIIDDEQLALEHFERLISEFSKIEVIGSYQNSLAALQAISEYRPDIVFIDIEMPGLTGIQIAKEISKELPDTHIVFVTAFHEYAVEAFEVNAVDYLVKPIRKERLEKTLERIEQIDGTIARQNINSNRICCFGELTFYIDQSHHIPVWRTRRSEELFHYLLHHRKQYISRDKLLEEFWPDTDVENAQAQLYSTIYQTRKTLEALDIKIEIINRNQRYRLELHDIEIDVDLIRSRLQHFTRLTEENLHDLIQILNLYEGHYFQDKGYLWAESEKENLRNLWFSHMIEAVTLLMEVAQYPVALRLAQQLREIEPFEQKSYFLKMKIYSLLQRDEMVHKEFIMLKQMVAEEFEEGPEQKIIDWYQNWQLKTSFLPNRR